MRSLLCVLLLLFAGALFAQNTETDSLKKLLAITTDNAKKVIVLEGLSYAYLAASPDTALRYATEGLELARSNNDAFGEALCSNALGNVYFHVGDNARALEMYLGYLKYKESQKKKQNLAVAYFNIASVYTEVGDYPLALDYISRAKREDQKAKDSSAVLYDDYSLGSVYQRMNKGDSALHFMRQSYEMAQILKDTNMLGAILNTFGAIYLQMDDTTSAFQYYKFSIPFAEVVSDNEVLTSNYYGLARIFERKKKIDSAIVYARKAIHLAQEAPYLKQVVEISDFLTDLFKSRKQFDSAFFYKQLNTQTRDSLFNIDQIKKVYNIKIQEQERQQALDVAKTKFRNQVQRYAGIFAILMISIIAFILWRNNQQKQKANLLLFQQKQKVEQALTELKSTQALLIQSEKMASLGQLTAGIAHEIQNPLNFINNFSELNTELLAEMQSEIQRGNMEEVKDIAHSIIENEKKINHHGKRADGIVKGMLQHSRAATGQKELADINALAHEYLRMSYRGFQAKDKSFTAAMSVAFDESIPLVDMVSQEIGRVLMNIFNNAFYSVHEKAAQHIPGFEPAVSVTTRQAGKGIELTVADNGNGIPEHIINKIFQPFFTTKPTGQGTGLGLSLSYDIVKAHGGQIRVESKEGEGSRFIVDLPV